MAKEMEKKQKVKHDEVEEVVDKMVDDKAKPKVKDFVAQLESITQMKNDGLLTEAEFQTLKKKIIEAQND